MENDWAGVNEFEVNFVNQSEEDTIWMNHLTFKLPIHRIATSIRRIQKHAYATMMRAMVLNQPRTPLQLQKIPIPKPLPNQILIKVTACGVCRTDLHVVDHDLKEPKLPLVPGHQIVGIVETEGNGFKKGQRVGVKCLACFRSIEE